MSPLIELSAAVRARRTDMGLTQESLSVLSGLSRATVNQVEKGTVKDLSMLRATRLLEVLGLSMSIDNPHSHRSRTHRPPRTSTPLDIAARTASVSYRRVVTPSELRRSLISGMAAPEVQPQIHALVDEAPVTLLASVVDQIHQEDGLERQLVWQHMRTLARALLSSRNIWQ